MGYSAQGLFDAYNELMLLNGLEPYPEGWYRNMRASFTALIAWCAERDIDPQRWVMAKHRAIGWRFRLSPKKLVKASDKFIAEFRAWREMHQADEEGQIAMLGSAIDDGTNGEMGYLSEALKRTFAGEPDTCLTAPETGWHPESRWCGACPHTGVCRVGR